MLFKYLVLGVHTSHKPEVSEPDDWASDIVVWQGSYCTVVPYRKHTTAHKNLSLNWWHKCSPEVLQWFTIILSTGWARPQGKRFLKQTASWCYNLLQLIVSRKGYYVVLHWFSSRLIPVLASLHILVSAIAMIPFTRSLSLMSANYLDITVSSGASLTALIGRLETSARQFSPDYNTVQWITVV